MDINLIAGCFICWLLILSPDTVDAQKDPRLTPVIKEFWLHNDASRVMSSASATVHATPNISCSAWSTLGPLTITVLRERDGAVLKKEVQNSVQFNLDPLRCEDTGVYLCQAENFQAKSTQKMEISVRCPPQLNRQHLPVGIDSPFYNGSVGGNLTIQLDIMSSPPPDWISLTTLNTKDVLASRSGNLTNGSGDSTKGQEPYWFEYIPTAPPYGSVELSIRNLSAKDIGILFTLVVGNGEGTNLSYAFMIKKGSCVSVYACDKSVTNYAANIRRCCASN